ncbi:MAG: ROK family protein [Anaerolineaceae bacterium]|nr:ROK family protein [Anaerolineaceae bacterium]
MTSLHASILKTLWKSPQSLADLQRATPVSLPTLRKAIQELTSERWIRVVGQADANGGRPAMLFGIDDTRYLLVGVHIQLPGLRLITSDLNGQVMHEETLFERIRPTPNEVIEAIETYVSEIRSCYPDQQLVGLGIAAPGFTHPITGDIISVGRVPGWDDFPICQRLQNSLGIPAVIANDVDCMAFAEFHESGRSFTENFIFVGLDEGVKISMFLNGALYKGSFGNTGLIRTKFLHVPSLESQDHNLEEIITITGINRIFEELVGKLPPAEQDRYAELMALSHRKRLRRILQADHNEFPLCVTIMQQLRAVLAVVIANTIYILQPDHVVLGGMLGAMSPKAFADLRRGVYAYLPELFANHIDMQQSQFHSPNMSAVGAIYHLIDDLMFAE